MQLFLTKTLLFYLGCLACYVLQREIHLTAVTAAALTGLVGSFLNFPKFYETKSLHSVIYAGAFAGMCSPEILTSHTDIALLSIIGGALYLTTRSYAQGFGGKLGLVSFISSLLFLALRQIL
jgi:hypothetical protein